ncbi:MAG: sugar phosphate isomerase/epimerase family protein [Planctomycetota bacterium]|nr:sugar phosphate isomerase/epimerase family protein [Planctomycetota bacterium]
MTTQLDRRHFLAATAAVPVAAVAAARFDLPSDNEPLFEISLAQWSLHRALRAGKVDNLDFAMVAKKGFGIEAIEYVNSFFKDKAKNAKYLGEMKTRAKDQGVKSLLIMCDGEGALGDPDEKKRATAIDNHRKWLDAASALGCHSIRVNAQSSGSWEEQRARAADGLGRLTELGAKQDLNVIVENHGGLSSNGKWLAEVMKTVGHERCGTLPDFGNFDLGGGKWYDRYKGVAELMPYAKAVSAKSHEFNASGDEVRTDYMKMVKLVLSAGYKGWIGIEYEGDQKTEEEGIKLTKRLLEKTRSALAKK